MSPANKTAMEKAMSETIKRKKRKRKQGLKNQSTWMEWMEINYSKELLSYFTELLAYLHETAHGKVCGLCCHDFGKETLLLRFSDVFLGL